MEDWKIVLYFWALGGIDMEEKQTKNLQEVNRTWTKYAIVKL